MSATKTTISAALATLLATSAAGIAHAQPGQLSEADGQPSQLDFQPESGVVSFSVYNYDDDTNPGKQVVCPGAASAAGKYVAYVPDNQAYRTLLQRLMTQSHAHFSFREGRDGRCLLVRLTTF